MTCELQNTPSKSVRKDLGSEFFAYGNSVYFREAQTIIQNFENNISQTNASASAITPYIELSKDVNTYIRNQIEWENSVDGAGNSVVSYFQETYPFLYDRMNTNPFITPVELEAFSREYFYFPSTTIPALSVGNRTYITNLNNYYRNQSFSQSGMGSFCALVPNIFGTIQAFFGVITGFAAKLEEIINSFQNLTLGGLVRQLQEQISSVIDSVVADIKNRLQNISYDFLSGRYNSSNESVIRRVDKLKTESEGYFSEGNITDLKKQIQGQIAYAISVFENPSIEEIQFILFRFCSMIGAVENALQSKMNPINALLSGYDTNYNGLAASSGLATARAIAAGATRYTTQDRLQRAETAFGVATREAGIEGVGGGSANFKQPLRGRYIEISPEDAKNMVPWNDGNGVSGVIIFSDKLKTLPNSQWKFNPWNEVDMRVRVYLSNVARQFGRQLIVTSGFRSIPYNNSLRAAGRGAAQNSLHTSGEAIDCTFSGLSDPVTRDNFLQIAFLNGFEWFKYYPEDNFIHVDVMDRPGSSGSLRSRFRGR